MCTGIGMTGIPRESRGCGRLVCGVPAGMEVNAAGIPRGWKKLHEIPADLIYLLHQRDVFLSQGGPWMTAEICSARILLMEFFFYMD